MSDPTTGREALIAELVGDLTTVLKRVDSLVPAVNAASADIIAASAALQDQVAKANERVAAMLEVAKVLVAKQIARQADQLTRASAEKQTRALELAVRELLHAEIAAALHRLDQAASRNANRHASSRLWRYVATAVLASISTAATTLWWRPM